jgi:drug/metabolite transporter (DMT)-like permease
MGYIAAIITAACWAATSIFFTSAGKVVGSVIVNRVRLLLAVSMLIVIHLVVTGQPLPWNAGWERWMWLGLSGIVGLFIGDMFLFESYVLIGPRLGTLILSLAPVISTVLAWVFLGEQLKPVVLAGIFVTIAGIAWVVLERRGDVDAPESTPAAPSRTYVLGVLCGLGAALGQAAGLILAKKGLAGDFSPISGVTMRMVAAAVTIWLAALVTGQAGRSLRAVWAHKPVLRTITLGAFVGPVIGVWLSLVSVQLAPVGIASTLMALTPVMMLPFARWLFKEPVSLRAILGTLVSIVGVVLLVM